MKRKDFLSSLLGAGVLIPYDQFKDEDDDPVISRPHYLKKGDVIGITCPAGFITAEEIQPAVTLIESWGFTVKAGKTVGKREMTFGGTDKERTEDFQQMMDDTSVKAILCARGGYGTVRIIDRLNFKKFSLHPKWIIGFSDITVIHNHLNHNYGIASIHSKMCNSFPEDWNNAEPVQIASILSIRQALTGTPMKYTTAFHECNKSGNGEGVLVGGNLKTIESLAGTPSDLKTKNKILFVEDTGEYLYSIDRMFWNLKRTGKLSGLKGLIIGGFKIKPDDPGEEFGKTFYDIVLEKVEQYHYPVCFNFPVGHQKENYALKCGVLHRLSVNKGGSVLEEID